VVGVWPSEGEVMVMLTAYYDAAGDPKAPHALVVGGYVSQGRAWDRFTIRWKEALARVGETELHLTDLISNGGRHKHWATKPIAEKAALIHKLSTLIDKNTQKGFSQAVLLDDWRQVNDLYKLKESRLTPYAISGYFAIDRTVRWWLQRQLGSQIVFIFENGDTNKGDLEWIMKTATTGYGGMLEFMRPVFKPKSLVPLQSADFVAWANRRAVQVWAGDHRKRLTSELAEAFIPLVHMTCPVSWDQPSLENNARLGLP
jgi:hypothetical protein